MTRTLPLLSLRSFFVLCKGRKDSLEATFATAGEKIKYDDLRPKPAGREIAIKIGKEK